ncbi:MAG: hypothetical protein HQ546_06090, partial [Planctomycetes bacterium]|nr:hypothetical protein [Planctomycetota bacterium]
MQPQWLTMVTTPGKSDLTAAVLSSRRRVVLVPAPVRTGKTLAALELYEHFLRDPAPPACLLLAPNRMTVRYLRRRLLDRSKPAVLVEPRVMTFGQLAERVLLAAGVQYRPISPVHRLAALRSIIADLAQLGRLKALHHVADTPGLVSAVDRCISELKRAAV